jgi:hypothetical protein
MNRIYKVIWSKTRNCYVAVSEIAKRNGKSCDIRGLRMAAVTLGVMAALVSFGSNVARADSITILDVADPNAGNNMTYSSDSNIWYPTLSSVSELNIKDGYGTNNSFAGCYYDENNVSNQTVNISGGTVSFIYGGFVKNGNINNNIVSFTGGSVKGIYGSCIISNSSSGVVSGNRVTLDGSGAVVREESYSNGVCAGYNWGTGAATGNQVEIKNGATVNNNVYGGYTYSGAAGGTTEGEGNKVIISSGTVTQGVFGGYVYGGTGTAGYNSVEISGGTVGASAFGGFSMNGAAEGNTVTMTGGTASGVIGGRSIRGSATGNTVDISQSSTDIETKITGEVYGGSVSSGSGAANNNTVTMTGVTAGNVYGGWARPDGAAINNKIKLENARVGYVYGGSSQGGEISKNSVTISKGQVSGVIGGTTIYGEVTENEVELDGVSSDFEILGGTSQYGNTTENSVKLSNSTVNHKIYGGVSIRKDASRNTVTLSDSTAERDIYGGYSNLGNVEENEVTIKGGTVKEKVYGGSTGGNANGNTVTISDGAAVKDNIYGGYSSGDCYYMDSTGNTPSTADGNTINISGSPDLSESEICGGSAYTSAQNNTINILSPVTVKGLTGGIKQTTGTVAGNALNVAAKNVTAGSVNGFQNMNFYLPSDIANNDTMLTVNGGSATDVKDVTFGVAALSGVNLQKGDTVNLLFNSNGLTAEDELKTADSSQLGSASFLTPNNLATDTKYELSISKKDGNTIITTVENVEGAPEPEPEPEPEPTPEPDYSGNERLKSLVETRAAMETMLNAGTDLLTGQGMDNAAYAAGDRDAGGGFNMFAAVGISKLRAKSGSHVDIKGIGLNLGLAREIENSSGKLLFAPVIEYGHGSYDSYQDNGIKADGNTSYWGLGLIAKQTNDNGFYYEGSIRGGRVKSDYDSDFSTATHASYDSAATYWAAHAGIGKLTDLGKDNTLDVYGKYFYSHTGSDSVTVHATGGDENVNFSSVNSHRARLGARLIHAINEKNKLYGGLAYQYEFSGEARATYNGGSTPSPSVKGSSGLIELGWQVKPGKGPMSVDFGVTGWVGRQRGITANLQANWTF